MMLLDTIRDWTTLSGHMLVLHSVSIIATALIIIFIPNLLAFFR